MVVFSCIFCVIYQEIGDVLMIEKLQKFKKFIWVIDKECVCRVVVVEIVWLFGLYVVWDVLVNFVCEKLCFVVMQNVLDCLGLLFEGIVLEIIDVCIFDCVVFLLLESVYQGVVLEVKVLIWGKLVDLVLFGLGKFLLVVLDCVIDLYNVGVILCLVEVFGVCVVIVFLCYSVFEIGVLVKMVLGVLECQFYLCVGNLVDVLIELKEMGYIVLGLDGMGDVFLFDVLVVLFGCVICFVLGVEGFGLCECMCEICDQILCIFFVVDFGLLNVLNVVVVVLYVVLQVGVDGL